MKNAEELYKEYEERMHRIADLRYANAVLQWDQETYLPTKGAHFRGQQISTLSELSHRFFSEDELGHLLRLARKGIGELVTAQRAVLG